jgi:hypothetical protein
MKTDHIPIGTMIYWAGTSWMLAEPTTCPDCLGAKKWNLSLPNGEAFTIECPRCHPGGYDTSKGTVQEDWNFHPVVQSGKVTGVEIDTASNTTYRVGSHSSIEEDKVFLSKAEAQVKADALTEEARKAKTEEEIYRFKSRARPKDRNTFSPAHTLYYCRDRIRKAEKEIETWTTHALKHGIDLTSKRGTKS